MLSYKHIVVNKSMSILHCTPSAFSFFSYFESDDFDEKFSKNSKSINRKKPDDDDDDLDYQPAPGSPSYQAGKKDEEEEEEDEDDPLEQFMKANNNQAKQDLESVGKKKDKKQEKYESKSMECNVSIWFRGTRDDIEKEDDQESYFRWLEENPTAGLPIADDDDEDRELQYDDDGINSSLLLVDGMLFFF